MIWLIQWTDKNYQKLDSSLNACAISFVQGLLGKNSSYAVETEEVGRQWNNIDVWALVKNKYFLIIEDKKGTKEHSDCKPLAPATARFHRVVTKQKNPTPFTSLFKPTTHPKKKIGYQVAERSRSQSLMHHPGQSSPNA